jgi:hypothetical protein
MSTTLAPTARPEPAPTGVPPRPPEAAAPGRDLALFLLLLVATDFSGLLHIYGLSWLYSESLFLGLGWTLIGVAALLLLLPARERPAWLRFPLQGARAGLPLIPVVGIGALAAGFLLQALREPPAWVARDPHADATPSALLLTLGLQLAVVLGIPAVAFAIGYERREAPRRTWLALLACALFLFSTVNLLYDAHVGAHAPDTWGILAGAGFAGAVGAGLLLAAAGGLVLLRPERFLAAAVGAGLALRIIGIIVIPLTLRLGDMLPLIGLSTARLLQAQSPYIVYQMPWDLPLTYWPLTVLSYAPVAAAGLDLRWVNLLFGPLAGALLIWAGGRRGPGAAGHAFGLLYLAPTMLQWDLSTAAPAYWLWLCLAFATAVVGTRRARGWVAPGLAAGAALAAAPLALPFLPFLGGTWLRQGWRVALRRTGAAVGVFALLVGPFVLWDPGGFWNGAVSWFNDIQRLPLLKWQTDRSWAMEIGVAGPLWQAGLQDWLKPLQALAVLGLFALSQIVRPRPLATAAGALRWGAAAYLLFMVVNPVIWPYLFAPALLALAFALLPAAGDAPADAGPHP